ncbi:hypothetical protein ABW20_dc0104356 [Dactylellina cionopaga]|nr:hypothetical protein ABW20_dc0104356 [Dactylellina cionopaga]
MPPSFGDKAYWDSRFTSSSSQFDWLLPASALSSAITSTIESTTSSNSEGPSILHIGCGTSDLSFHLRNLVNRPSQVYNVDFSAVAVEVGKAKEEELGSSQSQSQTFQSSQNAQGDINFMRWSTLDLLSLDQILAYKSALSPGQNFSMIIDKSTSDAISCADDVVVQIPYLMNNIVTYDPECRARTTPAQIHPMALLAVHLAYLSPPGGKWLALSYSRERFHFLTSADPRDNIVDPAIVAAGGFVDPRRLWQVVKIESLDAPEEGGSEHVVKRPAIKHTVYTLERTELGLEVC